MDKQARFTDALSCGERRPNMGKYALNQKCRRVIMFVTVQVVDRPCPTANMGVPGDDFVVSSLFKEVIRHGQAATTLLKCALLTPSIVIFICDVACLQLLGQCWGYAFDWAVGNVGGCCTEGKQNLVDQDRSGKHVNTKALE